MTKADPDPGSQPVDRHDLDAVKELMTAKFDGIERTLEGMQEALHVAAGERKQKDLELNEVRQRFVDRITFEQYRQAQDKALDAALEAAGARITPLEAFRNRAVGAGLILTLLAGVIGAAVVKAFGG